MFCVLALEKVQGDQICGHHTFHCFKPRLSAHRWPVAWFLSMRLIYSGVRTSKPWLLGMILLATRFYDGPQAKNSSCICKWLHFKWLRKYLQNSLHCASLPAKPRVLSGLLGQNLMTSATESQLYLYRD